MSDTSLINIYLNTNLDEPLGFVETDSTETTLATLRKTMEDELEGLPTEWRFLLVNGDKSVRVAPQQENKKSAGSVLKSFQGRGIVIQQIEGNRISSTPPKEPTLTLSNSQPLPSIHIQEEDDDENRLLTHSMSTTRATRASIRSIEQRGKVKEARNFWRQLDGAHDENVDKSSQLFKALTFKIDSAPITPMMDTSRSSTPIPLTSSIELPDVAVSSNTVQLLPELTRELQPAKDIHHEPSPIQPTEISSKSTEPPKQEEPTKIQEPRVSGTDLLDNSTDFGLDDDDDNERPQSTRIANLLMTPTLMDSASSTIDFRVRNSRTFTVDHERVHSLELFMHHRPSPLALLDKHILKREEIESKEGSPEDNTMDKIMGMYPHISDLNTSRRSLMTLTRRSSLVELNDNWRTEGSSKSVAQYELEQPEKYEFWYRDNFTDKIHLNFSGVNKSGPIVISIMRATDNIIPALIRTEERDERAFVDSGSRKPKNSKDYLKLLRTSFPNVLSNAKLTSVADEQIMKDLAQFEQTQVGIIFCDENQVTDDDMFGNRHGSPQYEEFLKLMGEKVKLQGWENYNGGLDVKRDSTGTHSVYTKYNGVEIMFHVPTLIPYTPNDPQQVERKRHVVIIVFKHGDTAFSPTVIKSQFNHVFVVVQPVYDGTTKRLRYKVAVTSKRGVPPFGPPIPTTAFFNHDENFRDFMLKKLLNGERAAMEAPIFSRKLLKARHDLLQNIVQTSYSLDDSGKHTFRASIIGLPSNTSSGNLRSASVSSSLMSITVNCRDLTVKTAAESTDTVRLLLEKLSKKMPESRHGYGLFLGSQLLDPDNSISVYDNGKATLSLDMKPLDALSPPEGFRNKSSRKFGSIGRMVGRNREGEIAISEPFAIRTSAERSPVGTPPDEIVSVLIKTHSDFSLETRVNSSSKMFVLRDKIKGNVQNTEDCHFWLHGRKISPDKIIGDCLREEGCSPTKTFQLDYGPMAPARKK
ncbi:hypothetical protein PROFUN_04590 [Planoprotostelium fungivorum]|uniref:Rap-GAP domain-containing protein n=1 Tax=Planoprotostelium fungivorum TaxID=1890364 RepID=A0A2P6NUB6_9EUKA|nr:hypothetical protein PROFUN_04590 [Planoprotostelium fungivorum]